MKGRFKSAVAVAAIAFMLVAATPMAMAFSDVSESASYAEAAEYLNDIGIMQGDTNGNFNPNNPVSRAEMAAIICRLLGETENLTTSSTFTDVPVSHWSNAYITKAASLGIIGGYGNGKFGPSDSVTYEQAVKMLVSAIGLSDSAEQSGGYPEGYLSVAKGKELLTGIPEQMGAALSRADIAQLLFNYYNQNI